LQHSSTNHLMPNAKLKTPGTSPHHPNKKAAAFCNGSKYVLEDFIPSPS